MFKYFISYVHFYVFEIQTEDTLYLCPEGSAIHQFQRVPNLDSLTITYKFYILTVRFVEFHFLYLFDLLSEMIKCLHAGVWSSCSVSNSC